MDDTKADYNARARANASGRGIPHITDVEPEAKDDIDKILRLNLIDTIVEL
jgi:hypothetical protein